MNCREMDLLLKLDLTFKQNDWKELSKLLNPKLFTALIAFPVLAKVAEILTTDNSLVPETIKAVCLKCLGNSCFNGYKHKEYKPYNIENDKYCHELYSILATYNENFGEEPKANNTYPHGSHFPYEGIAEWTSHYIISSYNKQLLNDQLEIQRLSIQFLCNLCTFACKDKGCIDLDCIPKCLQDADLKNVIVSLSQSNQLPLCRASCMFIHNILKDLQDYFTTLQKHCLCAQLLKPSKHGLESANDALLLLLCHANILQSVYEDLSIEDKLYILEIIYNTITESVYKSKEDPTLNIFAKDGIEFLSERFCTRSDLILKTVNTHLNDIEPTEIIILLDILGVLTSGNIEKYNFLKTDKNLLINCAYLLKSVQLIGKESNNCFTPMQKLSDVAPAAQGITIEDRLSDSSTTAQNAVNKNVASNSKILENDPHSHPAFGFKAGLIRIIGNMSYKNKVCQDLLRQMDVIPLLLDCCNIDARNPLIMQWTILALRNICEGNLENQEIIRHCTRVGVVESSLLNEMGLTLHEDDDGKKIGIVPLARKS